MIPEKQGEKMSGVTKKMLERLFVFKKIRLAIRNIDYFGIW